MTEQIRPKNSVEKSAKGNNSDKLSSESANYELEMDQISKFSEDIPSDPIHNRNSSLKYPPKDHPGIQTGDYVYINKIPYRIDAKIATGGMGVIWKTTNMNSNEVFALKQFLPQRYMDHQTGCSACEEYWLREQKLLQKQYSSQTPCMQYYGAVQITQFTDPEYYIIMEYINGPSLDKWLSQYYSESTLPKQNDIVPLIENLFIPMAKHLEYTHQQGIVHRDFTPRNILITTQNGKPVPIIIDWGVAKEKLPNQLFHPEKPYFKVKTDVATSIHSVGNPPELIGGYEPIAASDLYMFGAVMYYVFSGGKFNELPMFSSDYVIHLERSNPRLPLKLARLIEKLTQYEPADRPESFSEILIELKSLIQDQNQNDRTSTQTKNQDETYFSPNNSKENESTNNTAFISTTEKIRSEVYRLKKKAQKWWYRKQPELQYKWQESKKNASVYLSDQYTKKHAKLELWWAPLPQIEKFFVGIDIGLFGSALLFLPFNVITGIVFGFSATILFLALYSAHIKNKFKI